MFSILTIVFIQFGCISFFVYQEKSILRENGQLLLINARTTQRFDTHYLSIIHNTPTINYHFLKSNNTIDSDYLFNTATSLEISPAIDSNNMLLIQRKWADAPYFKNYLIISLFTLIITFSGLTLTMYHWINLKKRDNDQIKKLERTHRALQMYKIRAQKRE